MMGVFQSIMTSHISTKTVATHVKLIKSNCFSPLLHIVQKIVNTLLRIHLLSVIILRPGTLAHANLVYGYEHKSFRQLLEEGKVDSP